eukprot:4414221-Prymnesium_polylepis.1
MALRRAIAQKKAAQSSTPAPAPAAGEPPCEPPPAPSLSTQDGTASSATAAPVAPAGGSESNDRASGGGFQQGFLNKGAGALYPEGSTEAAPPLWGSTLRPAQPVLELTTLPERYEVVGRFHEAGRFLGKEDFAVTRNGRELHVKGNPQNDPQSCARAPLDRHALARTTPTPSCSFLAAHACARRLVAALDETIKLPLDAEWDGMSAEFAEYCLRISVGRNPDVAALLAELRTLLPEEE